MNSEKHIISAGIDIGGTNSRMALVSEEGKIISDASIPTRGESAESFVGILADTLKRLLSEAGISQEELAGIGVGAPCANEANGIIEAATDLPWPSPIPLADLIRRYFPDVRVRISNDANAAAVGEMRYGAASDTRNLIMITLGAGGGSGMVCDGRLLNGSRGFAGELGHCSVRGGEGRRCSCGRTDCLQTYCSASGVVTTAKKMLAASEAPSMLRHCETLTAKDIFDAAAKGDAMALEVWRFTGEVLGRACADFATFSDPDTIIFFGGVAGAFPFMEKSIRDALESNTLHLYRNRIRLKRSSLPASEAALLGAAALVFSVRLKFKV